MHATLAAGHLRAILPQLLLYGTHDSGRRVVIRHKRGTDAIETRVLTEGSARLDPPSFEVAVEAMFPPFEV